MKFKPNNIICFLLIVVILPFSSFKDDPKEIKPIKHNGIKLFAGQGKWANFKVTKDCDTTHFRIASTHIIKAMDRYPVKLLRKYISQVVIYEALCKNEACLGGTYIKEDLFITFRDGEDYLENVFHHEFGDMLVKANTKDFPKKEWMKLLPLEFKYWDKSEGIEYLKVYKTSVPCFEQEYLSDGFLSKFSKSGIDSDFNRYAEAIFLSKKEFWEAYEKHDLVKKKTDLVIAFYTKLDPIFTIDYFKKLGKKDEPAPRWRLN